MASTTRMCDDCKTAVGFWNLRARTKFLCEKCRIKLEWGFTEEDEKDAKRV